MSHSSIEAPTLEKLRAAFRSDPIDEAALKSVIDAYVDDRRKHNVHVEQVIREIRRVAEIEEGPIYRALYEPDLRNHAHQLINRTIIWAFERYFWQNLPGGA